MLNRLDNDADVCLALDPKLRAWAYEAVRLTGGRKAIVSCVQQGEEITLVTKTACPTGSYTVRAVWTEDHEVLTHEVIATEYKDQGPDKKPVPEPLTQTAKTKEWAYA